MVPYGAVAEWGQATAYPTEIYVHRKTTDQLMLSSLTVAESNIPPAYLSPPYTGISAAHWRSLVPKRLAISNAAVGKNMVFVNGLTTTPSAGLRAMRSLQLTLNSGLVRLINLRRYTCTIIRPCTRATSTCSLT